MLTTLLFVFWMLLFSIPLGSVLLKKIRRRDISKKSLIKSILIFLAGFVTFIGIKDVFNLWTDILWFEEVEYINRFWTVLGSKWEFFGIGFVVTAAFLLANLWITAIKSKTNEGEEKIILNTLILAGTIICIVLAIVFGLVASGEWETFLLYQNQSAFGVADPIFKKDIGFYMFTFPVLEYLNSAAFFMLVVSILIVGVFNSVMYFFYRDASNYRNQKGERTYKELMHATILRGMTHISVLGIFLMGTLIGHAYIAKWGMLFSSNSAVFGIGYTDAHCRLLAYDIFIYSLIISVILFVIAIFTRSLRKTIYMATAGFSVFMLVYLGGVVIWPSIYQHNKLKSNAIEKEMPYLQNNIKFTRIAYGISEDVMSEKKFSVDKTITADTISSNKDTIEAIRLWDWRVIVATNSQLQLFRNYYSFPDVDVVRYDVKGTLQQMMFSARELDQENLPDQAKTWQNMHMVYTHGFGACANPVNTFTAEGKPDYWISDIPPISKFPELEITQPRIYFGNKTDTHVYVKTKLAEFDYPQGDTNATNYYDGPAGIELNSPMRKFAFAMRFDGLPLLLSDEITDKSRIMFDRDLTTRVKKIAPFLRYDNDSYQVVAKKQLWYIWDAYTTSSRFPYSETYGKKDTNYIRNSVKVVMNAYTGKVDFYIFDDHDPIIKAYAKIFPGMFKQGSDMLKELRVHVRYPEDLLYIQGHMLTKYHMTDPTVFYNHEDAWDVAKEIVNINEAEPGEIQPYYILMKFPDEQRSEYVIMLPFTPKTVDTTHPRNNMEGWLAGRCDGKNYGKLVLYKFPKNTLVNGPRQIGININQDRIISKDFSLWNQQGSQVVLGNMLAIPISSHNILYVQSVYIQASSGKMPQIQQVVVSDGERLGYAQTFREALQQLLEVSSAQKSSIIASVSTGSQSDIAKQAAKHFELYQKLTAQGKFSEAGKEMEQLGATLKKLLDK